MSSAHYMMPRNIPPYPSCEGVKCVVVCLPTRSRFFGYPMLVLLCCRTRVVLSQLLRRDERPRYPFSPPLSSSCLFIAVMSVCGPPHITTQQPPLCCGAYGSSFLSIGPQTEGTMKSRVVLV